MSTSIFTGTGRSSTAASVGRPRVDPAIDVERFLLRLATTND